ncbi:MAG TPA: hypothetical protein VFL61_07675 [Gaiellaceae bacterium]|nr:hypothetical protein [Gaiellaceae bacterium]
MATALVLAIAVVWLLSYTLGPDTYYLPQEYSRWDHARKDNAWVVFVVSIALGVAGVFAVLAYAVGRISGWAAYALATAAVISFPIAYAAVTIGH